MVPSFFAHKFAIAIGVGLAAGLAPHAHADPIAAVGQIERTDNGGTCSAALVRPDVIVTAAHCADPNDAAVYRFRPGDGRPGTFAITDVVQHPHYTPNHPRLSWRFRFDIAVARLAAPIPVDRAAPFVPGDTAQTDETLFLVSWRKDEGPRPRQRACPVLEGATGLVTLACRVQGGESGAPVLRKTESGLELVAVISSRTSILDQPVAQASDVRLRLQPLLDALDRTP